MIYRCIAPDWLMKESPKSRRVQEGEFSEAQLKILNEKGFNVYFLPNYPSLYHPNTMVDGSQIDIFEYVFVDMDLKDGVWTKEDFIAFVLEKEILTPSKIIDSGNGIHVYWRVEDLTAMTFLKLQRSLCREYQTDEAVSKIYQLMRAPGYKNTKVKDSDKWCEVLFETENVYTCEQIANSIAPITREDEAYCKTHFNKTYKVDGEDVQVSDVIPVKFSQLVRDNKELKELWAGNTEDRSAGDYRIGHIMHANSFSKEEAMSVLVNTAKALARAPVHRINYASGIVDKIWTFEETKVTTGMARSVKSILAKSAEDTTRGTRFPCYNWLDNTKKGFRLTHIMGLIAGSGVGKTAIALNMFKGFLALNPQYDHFFVSLEQPAHEIAERWEEMCHKEYQLHDRMYVVDNLNDDDTYRHLGLKDIQEMILNYEKDTGRKVGCVVIDHIGLLKQETKGKGENDGLINVCKGLKELALTTNTFVIIQSQAPREKAGIGDLELNKDAAYGTVFFESMCDWIVTLWQPLKRCYAQDGCPTVTAFKFCKIRHKKVKQDVIQEDVPYRIYFDSDTGLLREMTNQEEASFDFFNKQAVNLRKQDRKTEIVPYKSASWTEQVAEGALNANIENDQDAERVS